MGVRGHGSNVHSWSEVISYKLWSIPPNHSDEMKDDLVLWVGHFSLEKFGSA
jgi:hypothetical protein